MTDKRKALSEFTGNLPPTSRLRACQTHRVASSRQGRDYYVKMDIASIPKIQAVILMGLDFSMRPERVRYELTKGFIAPLREDRVMHKMKTHALMVYNQEKFTPL